MYLYNVCSTKQVLDDDDDIFGSSSLVTGAKPKAKAQVIEDDDIFADSTINKPKGNVSRVKESN